MASGEEDTLTERDVAGDWLTQFRRWREDLARTHPDEPDAMVLATADGDARPSARSVLLKGVDERGFEFFTNQDSHKGADIAANPHASLVFPWYSLRRQVIVAGAVAAVEPERADKYFASRAYRSKLGALASRQSSVIADRSVLESALAQAQASYPSSGEVPRPPRWGGFRVVPVTVEFWQGRRDRLHDRLRFRRLPDGEWLLERLSP
jgi:pyridoxamine 5'-phosphate oxidase